MYYKKPINNFRNVFVKVLKVCTRIIGTVTMWLQKRSIKLFFCCWHTYIHTYSMQQSNMHLTSITNITLEGKWTYYLLSTTQMLIIPLIFLPRTQQKMYITVVVAGNRAKTVNFCDMTAIGQIKWNTKDRPVEGAPRLYFVYE